MHRWRAADQQPVTTRHAIAAALAAVVDEVVELARSTGTRPAVIACWQHAMYAADDVAIIDRLASVADVIVACVDRPALPVGAEHAELDADEPLAAEWSLTAITPYAALSFVATEVGTSLPAPTVESGRAFRYDVSLDTSEVIAVASRLLRDVGARIRPLAMAELRRTCTLLSDLTTDEDGDERERHPFEHRIEQIIADMDSDRRSRVPTPNPGGGLTTLADWLDDAGPRSPALGMIVVHATAPGITALLRAHAHAVGRVGDLIVDVPPDAAMIVIPDLTGAALQARTDTVRAATADSMGPGVRVSAIGAEVPAIEARHDLVGSLSHAIAALRQDVQAGRR